MLSVVLPAFNEELMILKATETIADLLKNEHISYEIIFVDDGSSDCTWDRIQEVSKLNPSIRGVRFSRNFGKEAAVFAGLAEIHGECCVVMDCDLQHPPEKIIEMYNLWKEGFEVVEGVKTHRGTENYIHKLCAKMFYKIMSKSTGVDMSRASDFKLLDKKVVEAILNLPERNAFFRALSSWVGFRTTYVEFEVREREAGCSKWSVMSLIKYAITNVAAFSTIPMQLVTFAGLTVFVMGTILGVQTLIKYFTGQAVEGFTTVILLLLIMGSILMMSLGIIGYYIAKIYEEVKGRPRYIVSERLEK